MSGKRILVVRTDRVGDVLLCTPVLSVLRSRFPQAHIAMLVSPYAREAVSGHPHLDEVFCDHRLEEHAGLRGFFRLVHQVRSRCFDTALVLSPSWRTALLVCWAGIGIRVGTGYRVYQFLFNRRVYEHRRPGKKHELIYNLSLARAIGASGGEIAPLMVFSQKDDRTAGELLADWSAKPETRLVLVHPGSGGSARDWTAQGFAGLADRLIEEGVARVILSGGPSDKAVVSRVAELMRQRPLTFPRTLSLKELAALIARCRLVVTNSTGPMHMATAVGTPVVALFSPIRSCSPQRWGPWGTGHAVIMPPVPSCKWCRGKRCSYYDCMALISVGEVYTAVRRVMDEENRSTEHIHHSGA